MITIEIVLHDDDDVIGIYNMLAQLKEMIERAD